jgi:malonyl-CoA O-methyltransferase
MSRPMNRGAAQSALPAISGTRRAFDRASAYFDTARFVHDEARSRLLERLDYLRIDVRHAADLGCATGAGAVALAQRYPGASVLAIDTSWRMLTRARAAVGNTAVVLAGDAGRLPFADRSIDLLFANLVLPWCDPVDVFREAARTLRGGGVFAFATVGPDTLGELRRAWAEVDDRVHVHAFVDMHDLGDLAGASGLAEPVMNVERLEITYADPARLIADLRACGAVNVAGGRRRTLTGPRRWARFEQGLKDRARHGRIAITVELIFGHAWGGGTAPTRQRAGSEVVWPAEGIPTLRRRGPPH